MQGEVVGGHFEGESMFILCLDVGGSSCIHK